MRENCTRKSLRAARRYKYAARQRVGSSPFLVSIIHDGRMYLRGKLFFLHRHILLFLRRRRPRPPLVACCAHSRESVCALLKRRCSLFRVVAPVSQHGLSIKFRCVSTNYATRAPASRLILAASPIVLMPRGPRSMGIGRLAPPPPLPPSI